MERLSENIGKTSGRQMILPDALRKELLLFYKKFMLFSLCFTWDMYIMKNKKPTGQSGKIEREID